MTILGSCARATSVALTVVVLAGCSSDSADPDDARNATTTTDAGPVESARVLSAQRQGSEYPLPADPHTAAAFSGNALAIIATVTSVGPVESVDALPNLTYPYAPVDVTVDEVLFGDSVPGADIVIRDLLGFSDDTPTAYEIGGQYVLMLNPAVDVAGTGEMLTPNWTFPLADDQLLWYDPDTGAVEGFDLSEYRQLVAEGQRAEAATST